MCWIGLFTKGKSFEEEKFQNAWSHNSDGAGFMYVKDKTVLVEKGFFDFKSFWESFSKIGDDCVRVVHFRKTSVGDNNEDNCHPFYINDDLAFVHNGTILGIKDYQKDDEKKYSDTYLFNEKILKPLIKKSATMIHASEDVQWLISRAIDKDKMVFLNKFGRAIVLNAHQGNWLEEKSIWTSSYDHNHKKYVHTGHSHYPQYPSQSSQNGIWVNGVWTPTSKSNELPKGIKPWTEFLSDIYKEYCDDIAEEFKGMCV
jgi:predicted glutamine amidotransferase